MTVVLGDLRASYTRRELLGSLRSVCSGLAKADQGETAVYPGDYDIRVKDSAPEPNDISLRLPHMFRQVQVDAHVDLGTWRNSLFMVTRFEEGHILIQQANFPTPWSPSRDITVDEVRLYPGGACQPKLTSIHMGLEDLASTELGLGNLGSKFTSDSFASDTGFPQARVDAMIQRAEQQVAKGSNDPWGFVNAPVAQFTHDEDYRYNPSPL